MSDDVFATAKIISDHKQLFVDTINSPANRVRYNFNEQLKNENLEKLSLIENIILVYQQIVDMRNAAQAKVAHAERERVKKLLGTRQQAVSAELNKVDELEDKIIQRKTSIQLQRENAAAALQRAEELSAEIQWLEFQQERVSFETSEQQRRISIEAERENEVRNLLSDLCREAEAIARKDLICLRSRRVAIDAVIGQLLDDYKKQNELREVERAAFQIAIKQQQAECEEVADRIRAARKASSRPVSPAPESPPPSTQNHETHNLFHGIGLRAGLHKGFKLLLPLVRHNSPTRGDPVDAQHVSNGDPDHPQKSRSESLVIEQRLSHEVHALADQVAWYEHQREILKAFASSPSVTAQQLVQLLMKVPEHVEDKGVES